MFNLEELTIDDNALQTLRKEFAVSIQEGLEHNNKQIAALPTFLERAPSEKAGECLVLDCGGTNIRAARVHLKNDQSIEVVAGPVKGAVPDSVSGTPAHVFLDRHVDYHNSRYFRTSTWLFSYPSENSEPVTQSCCDGRKGFSLKVWWRTRGPPVAEVCLEVYRNYKSERSQ